MTPELNKRYARLLEFVREHKAPGGCKIVSKGAACECILCDVETLKEALKENTTPWLNNWQVAEMFGWPFSRVKRLVKAGKLPAYQLPDGTLAFKKVELNALIKPYRAEPQETQK